MFFVLMHIQEHMTGSVTAGLDRDKKISLVTGPPWYYRKSHKAFVINLNLHRPHYSAILDST